MLSSVDGQNVLSSVDILNMQSSVDGLNVQSSANIKFDLKETAPCYYIPHVLISSCLLFSSICRLDFTTEQRSQFEGYDTNVHKRADLVRKSAGNIDKPGVKFHTTTTHKVSVIFCIISLLR